MRQADVLAGVPETDVWVVAGRSDTREDRIEVRRTWLRGAGTGRWAMILSFAAYRQALDSRSSSARRSPPTCIAIRGRRGVPWSASATPMQARRSRSPRRPASVVDACAAVGEALAAEPWLDRVPVTVSAAPTLVDGRWVLTDDTGAVALAPEAPGFPTLLAASLGQPVDVTIEWTVDGAVPLTVHLADRGHRPTSRPLVRERGMTSWRSPATQAVAGRSLAGARSLASVRVHR